MKINLIIAETIENNIFTQRLSASVVKMVSEKAISLMKIIQRVKACILDISRKNILQKEIVKWKNIEK